MDGFASADTSETPQNQQRRLLLRPTNVNNQGTLQEGCKTTSLIQSEVKPPDNEGSQQLELTTGSHGDLTVSASIVLLHPLPVPAGLGISQD